MNKLLTGKFARAIDEKQRIAVPKKLRDAFHREGESALAYVAPGTDGSLSIYTEDSFSRLADQLSAASPNGQDVRAFSRLFFSQAECLEIDRQGRIRIPPELVAHAGLEKEVMLVGVRDHIELWDLNKWEKYVAQQQANYDSLAESAFSPRP
ncbi:MAG: division/cell wall cluster transcriptional repressor MraZ [Planctomycetales bacterium]|nr:division/cell wall cluster transcriptional repressor MraZ [Planctomycetales bacterium]